MDNTITNKALDDTHDDSSICKKTVDNILSDKLDTTTKSNDTDESLLSTDDSETAEEIYNDGGDDDEFDDGQFDDEEEDDDDDYDELFRQYKEEYCNRANMNINTDNNLMKGLKLQQLGKNEYMLPKQSAAVMICSDITLNTDNKTTIKIPGQPLSIKYDNNVNIYTFTLNNVQKIKDSDCYLYVYFCNDRTKKEPLYKVKFNYDYINECAKAELPAYNLYYGNYILLFDKIASHCKHYEHFGNSICLPMHVYEECTFYPAVTHTSGKIDSSRTEISLKITFKPTMPFYFGFNLDIYNNNYNLVAQATNTAWSYKYKYERRQFKFIATADIPLKGKHFAILNINGFPTHCIYFNVDENGITFENDVFRKASINEKRFANKVKNSYYWNKLKDICGYSSAKRCIHQIDMYDFFNELRRDKNLSKIAVNHNIMYYGGYSNDELKMLHILLMTLNDISTTSEGDCINLCEAKNTCDPYDDATNLFSNSKETGILLYNISALTSNSIVVNKLLNTLQKEEYHSVCLVGSKGEIEQLFQTYPQLTEFFPKENSIERHIFTADDFVHQCITTLMNNDLIPTREARDKIINSIEKAFAEGALFGWTLNDVNLFTKKHIVDNYYKRQSKNIWEIYEFSRKDFATIEACDIDSSIICDKKTSPFEESIKQLNAMVGLQDIKSSITTTFNRIKVGEERKRLGLKVNNDTCNHMIFTGNPGTGKTTVAKMVGKIYHSLGLLSKGDVICADRSKIVGRYIGETERNMHRLLSEAKGNVLFIDEAYTLCDTTEDRKDFGYRAIECLLTVLAQKEADIIVIFAGYEKEMNRMMESNQGLSGRFPYKFNFKDYTAQELTEIALNLLNEEEYILTPEADEQLRVTIADAVKSKSKSFSNARWVEQYVNKGIKQAQSDRLAQTCSTPTVEKYQKIEVEDIRVAYEQQKPIEDAQHRAIGFIA